MTCVSRSLVAVPKDDCAGCGCTLPVDEMWLDCKTLAFTCDACEGITHALPCNAVTLP
jgi:hypothetical protein